MELQVQFAHPHGDLISIFTCTVKELLRSFHDNFGSTAKGAKTIDALEHFTGGAAAAITVAEGHERDACVPLVLEILDSVGQVLARYFCTVSVHGREVREDSRAVDAFPQQSVVRESIDLVP